MRGESTFFSDWTLSELLSSCFEWRQVQKTKDFKFSFMIAWFLLQKLQKRSGLWSRTFWKQGLWRMTYRWKHSINRVFWIYQQDRICPLVYLIIPSVPCAKLNTFCIYVVVSLNCIRNALFRFCYYYCKKSHSQS